MLKMLSLMSEYRPVRAIGIVFPFIIWFYGSAIVIIRGWGCGFGNSEDIVTWSDNRRSFAVLGFMAVVAYLTP
jgi:hypothetical protein